jgi:hypothetical protein
MSMIIEAITKIEQELGTDRITSKLLSLPQQIRSAELDVAIRRTNLKDAQAALDLESGRLLLEIQAEQNPATGKPAYSNAETRAAELAKRQTTDAAYQAAASAVREAENQLKDAELSAQVLRDELLAHRAIAELTAARLRLYA